MKTSKKVTQNGEAQFVQKKKITLFTIVFYIIANQKVKTLSTKEAYESIVHMIF